MQIAWLSSLRMNSKADETSHNETVREPDRQPSSGKQTGREAAPVDPFQGAVGLSEDDLALLRSWDDEELNRLDLEAAEKEVEADELTHGQVFLERLQHLFYTTMWFVVLLRWPAVSISWRPGSGAGVYATRRKSLLNTVLTC